MLTYKEFRAHTTNPSPERWRREHLLPRLATHRATMLVRQSIADYLGRDTLARLRNAYPAAF